MEIAYILQIITIIITVALGMVTYFQNKKLQHGQNIIAINTTYRIKRSEQLKDCTERILTNTNPELLKLQADAFDMLKAGVQASEEIGAIMHRNFAPDLEIITIANTVTDTAIRYNQSSYKDDEILNELLYNRELFKLKCDIYTSAEWRRAKNETKGENTSAESWFKDYYELEEGFLNDFESLKLKYNK